MVNIDSAEEAFSQIDQRQEAVDECRDYTTKTRVTTTAYEPSTLIHERDYVTDRYSSISHEQVVNTTTAEETRAYLARIAPDICTESNSQIIRRATTDVPVTYEQRVLVRYLQPPPLPPPEPLIIQEVAGEPSAPLPPIHIREQPRPHCVEAPLILRERPPVPPPRLPGETITRIVPGPPAARSVIIERLPQPPEKPRDIIIERWLPYGPECERRTIVRRATCQTYARPTCKIFVYDGAEKRISRKFENLGTVQENPEAYIARYGSTLLDSATLVQRAREAGVVEDISLRLASSVITTTDRRNVLDTFDYDRTNDLITRNYTSATQPFTTSSITTRTIQETRNGASGDQSTYPY